MGCCAGDNVAVEHIKNVDNITKFFNSDIHGDLRKRFKLKDFPEQCEVCKVHWEAGRIARFDSYNRFNFPTYKEDINSETIPIRFWKLLLVIFVIRCALLVVENT